MLYRAKGRFQKVVRWLGGSWMTANMATALGCVSILLVAGAFYAGLACEGLRWLLLLAWAAEFFGVLGKGMPGGNRRHETFLGGKPDRAVWMGALAVLLFAFPGFLPHVDRYLAVACVFVALTSVIRVRKTIQAARGHQYHSYTWIGK